MNAEGKDLEMITEIKKNEASPFSGVLLPVDEFYQYEKAQRQLDYVLKNPPPCDSCDEDDGPWSEIMFGLIIGVLAGVSVSN